MLGGACQFYDGLHSGDAVVTMQPLRHEARDDSALMIVSAAILLAISYVFTSCSASRRKDSPMKVLLSKEQLHDGVAGMAARIEEAYEGRQLTIVGVLTGSVVLVADLIRHIDQPMRVGVIQTSSYRGATTTRGDLIINSELMLDISGRDVLLVDDIFDTGVTLAQVVEKLARLQTP